MMVPSLSNRMPRMAMAPPGCAGAWHASGRTHAVLLRARVDGEITDGRRSARQRIVRVPRNLDLAEACAAGVVKYEPPRQSLADPQNLLQHLRCLQRADDADGGAQHAHLG